MTKDDSQILIVGAGPAGIATALFLAKKGIPSKLIDKEFFPRDKICGDGLSGWVISMLYKLDMGLVEELANDKRALDSWGISFVAPNLKRLTLPYQNKKRPDEAPGYVIRRTDFDDLLIKKVKENPLIELVEGVKISGYKELPDGVEISDSSGRKVFKGDVVVFADGAGSQFAKEPGGIQREDKHTATGIKVYYSGIKPRLEALGFRLEYEYKEEGMSNELGNSVEFYFLKSVLPGYLWIFPLPDGGANVGMGIRTDIMKKKKIKLKKALFDAIRDTPELKERFKDAEQIGSVQAWGLPLGSKKRSLSGNRFLLAGDAASLIDPFTGEGIGNALNSGFHAAEHLAECFKENRFDSAFNQKYDKRVYDKLWKELRMSTVIQKLIIKPWLFSWVMNKAVSNEYLKKSFIRMIDDLEEREKLRRVGFYWKVLFAAKGR
ncbi:MAG: geranylgeranyl reductase family protein [Bacteroidota bacterium]|nr:geranylgeranyl reductase family protein [Bacteroidota bacterium]